MKFVASLLKSVLVLLLLVVLAFAGMSGWSRLAPPQLGLVDGRLRDCPPRPNCVSSQATSAEHQIEPLPWVGDRAATEAALRGALMRLNLVSDQRDADYWRQHAVSLIFRFIDDVEIVFDDEARVLHVRSASRAGYSDRGVNRARVEAIRQAMQAQ